jgi:hypothetical protein
MSYDGKITSHARCRFAIFLLALAFTVVGCSSKHAVDESARTEAPGERSVSGEPRKGSAVTRNYDVEGRLLPSGQYVAGVRLPRGCELFLESDLRHVYRIRAPIAKVLAYFGPMMITGNVERRGKGAIYKRASVRGAEVSPTKLDVSILEVGSSMTRIAITELPPPPPYVPSADQTKAAARDTWRTLD